MRKPESQTRGLLWALVLALAALEAAYLYTHVHFPYLLVASEDGMYMTARAFQQGWDPWALDKAVLYSNNYGWLYPWVGAKLSAVVPALNLLQVLRWLSVGAVLVSLGLLYRVLRMALVDRLAAGATLVAVAAALLYYDTVTIRPDAFALMFYLAALALASSRHRAAPVLAACMAALGALAKPYAILAAPLVALHLWSQGRRKDAGLALLSAGIAGLLLLGLTLWLHPDYLAGTAGALSADTRYELSHLFLQNGVMARTHAVLLLASLALLIWKRAWKPQAEARAWLWMSLAVWLLMAGGLGGHLGAFLRYYQQLFLPLALVAFVLWAAQAGLDPRLLALLLILDAAAMLSYDLSSYPLKALSAQSQADWKKAEALVRRYPRGAYPPVMTALAEAQGPLMAPTEHSRHLLRIPARNPAIAAYQAQIRAMGEKFKLGQVPLIVGSPSPELESAGYRVVDRLLLDTPLSSPEERGYLAVYAH